MSSSSPAARKPRRRVRTAAAAVLLPATAVLFGIGGSAADAATSTITCAGSSAIGYSPGLLFATRSVYYQETDAYSTCTSTDPTLTSGSSTAHATLDATCLAVPGTAEDPHYVVHWNNGQSSTFDLTYLDTIVAGTENVTGTGTVIAGELLGGTGVFTWTYPVLNPLQCLADPGVTSQTGILVATVIHP